MPPVHTYHCCGSGIPNPTKKEIPSSLTLPQVENEFHKIVNYLIGMSTAKISIFNPKFFTKL